MQYNGNKNNKGSKSIYMLSLVLIIFLALNNEFNIISKIKSFTNLNTENMEEFFSNEENNIENNKSVESIDGELQVHFVDVGQGDATLITYNDFVILIDTGEYYAEDDLLNYMDDVGVDDIDIFIGTHPHSDHIGNVKAVYDEYLVKKTIIPNAVHTTKTFEKMITAIEDEGTEVVEGKYGVVEEFGDLKLEIISPLRDSYEDLNDYSIVTKLTYKDISILSSGDATKLVEQDILDKGADINVDVLKVAHHGSESSSKNEFIAQTNAKYGIISVGLDNDYNHPRTTVLDRLNNNNIQVLRTDESGNIILTTDGTKYSLKNK